MRLVIRYGVGCCVDRTLYIKKIDADFLMKSKSPVVKFFSMWPAQTEKFLLF